MARRQDLATALRALADFRLVTFTGHGGVGKTRLALELAYRARDGFPDGAWIVCLADLTIGAEVAEVESAIVSALGISDQSTSSPREKLVSFLATRKLLLVIDNCEHVLTAVRATLTVLLRDTPKLRVIATSRESLGIAAEKVRPVLPLSVPEPGTPADQLIADGSVSLLLERASAVDPGFELTANNADAVVQLCRALEGLPLAIELAAVKLRALSVEQVVERFGRRVTLLNDTGQGFTARHRSVRSMVDWSYELCPQTVRVLWRRLSIFPATFDLGIAESVCAFGELHADDVMDSIDQLVAQSILSTSRGAGTMRYRLPAAIREVAADLADKSDETAELHRRHRDAMLSRATETLRRWCGPHQSVLIEQMCLDHADYVAALQWSMMTTGEEQTALLLSASLRYHYITGGRLAEGRMRMEAALAAFSESSPARGDCLWVTAWIALIQGDRQRAEELLNDLSFLARNPERPGLAAHLHHWSALLAMSYGDLEGAIGGYEAAIKEHRALGNPYLELTARYMLSCALAVGGFPQRALDLSIETRELCQQYGEQNAHAYACYAGGLAHWILGEFDDAERSARLALETHRTMGGIGVALATSLLSWIARDRKQYDRCADLDSAASDVWRLLGTSIEAFGPTCAGFAEQHCSHETKQLHAGRSHPTERFQDSR